MKIDISVIVAVYNEPKLLSRALNGIAQQHFQNFEVLIINDGSTDASPQIAAKFSEEDPRFKLQHKEHGGIASARNLGLEKAKGAYIIHHDADDYLPSENVLGQLFKLASTEDADIVIGDYNLITKSRTMRIKQGFNGHPSQHIRYLLHNKYHAGLWNKLIKKSLYGKIKFVKDINYMEDKLLMVRLLNKNPKMVYLPEIVYNYVNTNPLSNQISEADLSSIKLVIEQLEKEFQQKNLSYDLTYQKLHYKLLAILNNIPINQGKVFKEVNTNIFETHDLPWRHKLLLYFESIGIHFFSKFYVILIRYKK